MPSKHEMTLLEASCKGKGVNIGCGPRPFENAINIDISTNSKADVFADAAYLPLPSNHFDFLVSAHCLEHIDKGPLLVLIEWLRILKIGGQMAILVPNGEEGIISMRGDVGTFQKGHHVHVFTCQTLQTLLDYAGGCDTTTKIIQRPEWTTTTILARTRKRFVNKELQPKSLRSRLMWMKSVKKTVTPIGLLKWLRR